MPKILAILGGGDWFDASANFVAMLTDRPAIELEQEYKEDRKTRKYISFHEWLVEKGYARKPEDSELEEHWEAW